jgi:capsular exopolysaccharide synthesis family protein
MSTRNSFREPARWNPPGPEAHLRDYWYVLLKRRWLVAAIALAALVVTAIATLAPAPKYKATAVIQIDRGKINLVQDVRAEDQRTGYAEFYATQRRVLMSRTLVARVMDHLNLWQHPLFQSKPGVESTAAREQQIDKFLAMMEVLPVGITQLIEVSFLSPEPELSSRLANGHVKQYIQFSSESDSGVARGATSFIREQIEKIRKEIQQKEQALQEYSQRQDVVITDSKDNIVLQKLEDLNRQLAEAEGQRTAAEARYQSLRRADPGSLPEVLANGSIQNLKQAYARGEDECTELAERFSADWPELQRRRRALEKLKERLERETREVASKVIAAARTDYEAALQREKLLQQSVDGQKGQAQALTKVSADYESIKVGLDNQQKMLQELLRRETETTIRGDLGERLPVNVRIVEEATTPTGRFRPHLWRTLGVGVLVGIILALGVAFFLDYWDTAIYTIEDLRRHVGLPYLGMVPHESFNVEPPAGRRLLGSCRSNGRSFSSTSGDLPALRSHDLPALNGGNSILAERFKFLRSSLLFSSPGAPPKTVLVTSPEKHAGKTFVTCNLAASLTELDKKVLIIDGDLRNPRLHRVFRMRNKEGLSTVLTGQKSIDDGVVSRTSLPNIFVLLAGPLCPRPAELLGSRVMEQILERCGEEFDFILVDSAPLLPVIDTHALAGRCAAVLLVVRSGQTSRYAVNSCVETLERAQANITGVVLNDVNLNDYAQYYYHSHYSYEYGSYSGRPYA